jgi:hypothetical protein
MVALAGVLVVGGLGLGVNHALTPDVANVATRSTQPNSGVATSRAGELPTGIATASDTVRTSPSASSSSGQAFTAKGDLTAADQSSVASDVLAFLRRQVGGDKKGQYRDKAGTWLLIEPEHMAIVQELDSKSVEIGEPEMRNGVMTEHVRATADLARVKGSWPIDSAVGTFLFAQVPDGQFYLDIWYTKDRGVSFVDVSTSSARSADIATLYFA